MSDAALRTDGSLEAQPKMGVRNLHGFATCPRLSCLPEIIHPQPASFNDALECADGDRFVSVPGHDNLPTIGMTPFLVAAFLADHPKAVFAENSNNFLGVANWKAFAHVSATSKIFAPAGTESGDGSNQSSSASLALRTASSSVSPADAQPGNSGKKAAHRFVLGSCSSTNRSFMVGTVIVCLPAGKATASAGRPACRSLY